MTCRDAAPVAMRHDLKNDILAGFDHLDECQDWLRANHRVDLQQLVRRLFPPPVAATPAESLDHHVRCMIGAFSHSECLAALKIFELEKSSLKKGLTAFHTFRCACLNHIQKFYANLKNPP